MKPLLFILVVTGFSVLISHNFSADVTWFTYYIGGMSGLIMSGISIEIWNKRMRKQEERDPTSLAL